MGQLWPVSVLASTQADAESSSCLGLRDVPSSRLPRVASRSSARGPRRSRSSAPSASLPCQTTYVHFARLGHPVQSTAANWNRADTCFVLAPDFALLLLLRRPCSRRRTLRRCRPPLPLLPAHSQPRTAFTASRRTSRSTSRPATPRTPSPPRSRSPPHNRAGFRRWTDRFLGAVDEGVVRCCVILTGLYRHQERRDCGVWRCWCWCGSCSPCVFRRPGHSPPSGLPPRHSTFAGAL